MPSNKRKRTEAQNFTEDQVDKPCYPPEKFKHYLACPFVKHDPDLHLSVGNVCTERWGFKNIGDLNYHIQRVHSMTFGCIDCKSRFTKATKATIEKVKQRHDCKPRGFTDEDPQWMTEEQESRLEKWKEPGKAQEGGAKSWVKIYTCLFETAEKDVPSPFYDYMVPMHLVSDLSRDNIQKHSIPVDTINPSLTQQVRNKTQDLGNLMTLEGDDKHQLDRNTLRIYKSQDIHPYDWSVTRTKDSGYESGNMQDLQERDTFFSQDQSISYVQPLLYPEDTETLVKGSTGNLDEAGIDYDRYLNLDDNDK